MKRTFWLAICVTLLSASLTPQELLPVTAENEYRCKADTLRYFENHQELAPKFSYQELSKRVDRMNECGWLFSQLVIKIMDRHRRS